MNPEADPVLEALFATPLREVSDDERALQSLLARLERTDRRRGVILTAAGAVGAALAIGVIAVTHGVAASVTGLATVSMRVTHALAQAAPSWSLPEWSVTVPDGTFAIAAGVLVLAGAVGAAFRWRGFGA